MNTTIGLLIIALGSIGQSSSYGPVKSIKSWAWESRWLVQGLFGWLVFPLLGALLAIPAGQSLVDLYASNPEALVNSILLGVGWGIGGLIFGLSLRLLGFGLSQSISLGACSAFGTLLPALIMGQDLFSGTGLVVLIAVSIGIAGIIFIGKALTLRIGRLSEEEQKKAVEHFSFGEGIFIAIVAGLMSACFGFGLITAEPFRVSALEMGSNPMLAGLPSIFLVTIGGLLVNTIFSVSQNIAKKTAKDYFSVSAPVFFRNVLLSALAGGLWYFQFVGLTVGKSFFADNLVMIAFSWSILMVLNVTFSNLWGLLFKKWRGLNFITVTLLIIGLLMLIFSIIYPTLI